MQRSTKWENKAKTGENICKYIFNRTVIQNIELLKLKNTKKKFFYWTIDIDTSTKKLYTWQVTISKDGPCHVSSGN